MDKEDKEDIGCLIFTIILSVFFGIVVGIGKCSFWWGIGVTIGSFVMFILGWGLGLMMDGIDEELKDRRNNKR